MNAKIFDSHSHYDSDRYDADRDALLSEMLCSSVGKIMSCGDSIASSRANAALALRYDGIYAAAGVHPEEAEATDEETYIDELRELILSCPKIRAVGEIGLDYHYDIPKELQLRFFTRQLELAQELKLPVIMHDRDAHGDMTEVVRKYRPRGVMHCFSGSVESARELAAMGIFIGFTGVVTFKNSRKAREVASLIPEELLLIETDAPYLAPVPHRGERNRSDYLIEVAREIAAIRGVDTERILRISYDNACRLFSV